jgi:uncharacterized Zn-binding protein involved in type VI secretion
MTELLSQAYSLGEGIFECPNWMHILIRDTEDALTYIEGKKAARIGDSIQCGDAIAQGSANSFIE